MKQIKLSTVLTKSARLLKRKGWTKGAWARDVEGEDVSAYDSDACTFCPEGAVIHVTGLRGQIAFRAAKAKLDESARALFPRYRSILEFNDSPESTLEQVIEVFDHATQQAIKAGD